MDELSAVRIPTVFSVSMHLFEIICLYIQAFLLQRLDCCCWQLSRKHEVNANSDESMQLQNHSVNSGPHFNSRSAWTYFR